MSDFIAAIPFPRLVPQWVHYEVLARGSNCEEYFVYQRDCVENLVRNTFNLAYLCADGAFRPGVEDVIENTRLKQYYRSLLSVDRVAPSIESSRDWLESTIGLENFGVQYDQGGREVLTGLDNILSLFEGIMCKASADLLCDNPSSAIPAEAGSAGTDDVKSTSAATPRETDPPISPSIVFQRRAARLSKLCDLLSTSTLRVSWHYNGNVQNYHDVDLKFRCIHSGTKKVESKVKWLITKDHVCMRHGNELSS